MSTESGSRALTGRQAQVVDLVAKGHSTKEIASALVVSERAVTAVLSRLFRRFGVPNRAGLIAALLAPSPGRAVAEFGPYDQAPFMAAVTEGPRHRYIFVNRLAAQAAGRPATTLVGREVHEIYPDIDPQFITALDEVFRAGRPWGVANAATRFTHADGTHRDTHLNLIFQPIRDQAGRTTGILHVGTELPD